MKVSICITVFNAEKLIAPLLQSLLAQIKKADEIVIVDGGSTDKTVEIIKHFQRKHKEIKILLDNCFRARGRNLAVEIAQYPIIAMTDAGCVARKAWLKRITGPFVHPEVDIVAGVYESVGDTPMQKALGLFLGYPISKFGVNFLPTARSIAFRKEAWEKVGGFPEKEQNSAEDTEFNYKAIKLGLKYSRVKDAAVEWGIPRTLREGIETMGDYAKWDARSAIWWHPTQKLSSHNIRILSIFLRYLVGLSLLVLGFSSPPLFLIGAFGFIIYLIWAFRKVFIEFQNFRVAVWGPVIQILSDIAIMAGFIRGTIRK
ncbi:hypothetical protein A2115_00280 [Candidatus Woesebacteria bacterium GWA1_41_8]|uniref:Glycosyltransferase 2-like domain-containing protein n=1 Tax=Candidatus Woesebacteria bacterium GWA1_41_8 TaxID=1802471 RepID=A0A1F7WGD2_9BACT|nr:MAG: hypothetical protein A2115_00280 [Candidatus Woesebacteria bacterium GWA1_41_8]